jgi:hypothetical protein
MYQWQAQMPLRCVTHDPSQCVGQETPRAVCLRAAARNSLIGFDFGVDSS